MQVLVAGATGFVGSRLCTALVDAGHDVRAMTRHPESYAGPGVAVGGDVGDPSSMAAAMNDCQAAYYLVHSLDSVDFSTRDRQGAENFGTAAATAGLRQVVYLGGLGNEREELSAHLASRREVEAILRARVATTVLRAGIVIGDGGISWEILRQLVAKLPVMVTPRWVQTRTQPVAIEDAVTFLVAVLGRDEALGEVYEVGGPEAMTYGQMLKQVGRMPGGVLKLIVPVPLLTPRLSSYWLRLVTDVDLQTARSLIDSMSNEVVVHDRRIEELTGHRAMEFNEAAERALPRPGQPRRASCGGLTCSPLLYPRRDLGRRRSFVAEGRWSQPPSSVEQPSWRQRSPPPRARASFSALG